MLAVRGYGFFHTINCVFLDVLLAEFKRLILETLLKVTESF